MESWGVSDLLIDFLVDFYLKMCIESDQRCSGEVSKGDEIWVYLWGVLFAVIAYQMGESRVEIWGISDASADFLMIFRWCFH